MRDRLAGSRPAHEVPNHPSPISGGKPFFDQPLANGEFLSLLLQGTRANSREGVLQRNVWFVGASWGRSLWRPPIAVWSLEDCDEPLGTGASRRVVSLDRARIMNAILPSLGGATAARERPR